MKKSRAFLAAGSLLVLACESETTKIIGPPLPPCETETCLLGRLQAAYAQRDFDGFAALFHPDFLYAVETDTGRVEIGREEWLRIHGRMFRPGDTPPGEPPVPAELWLVRIDVGLVPITPFVERHDLYRDPESNPGGLDPARWRATGATFRTDFRLETQGQLDYRVESRADFAVAHDRARRPGQWRRLTIYRWEDLEGIDFPAGWRARINPPDR